MSEAGVARVPFEGDFSALQAAAGDAVVKLGEKFKSPIFGGVMGGAAAVATTLVGVAGAAIDLGTKFTTSTDKMAAAAQITQQQAKAIGDAFLSTGGQTTFTAQAMMDAFSPVAGQLAQTAGHALNASDSLTFMNAAMAAAEARGQPLATVTGALANVMQAYGLQAGQAAHVSDVLTNTSAALNIPIADLTSGFDKLHAKLGDAAPSLQDTGALMLVMADHGLSGSRAVMAVSSGLTTLESGSKTVNAELGKLGVQVYDSSGKFVGMDSVIAQLQPKLATMSDAQRTLALNTLFGKGAAQSLGDVIMGGVAAFDAASASVGKTGSAQAAAATATDNLGGSFERLKSAVIDQVTSWGSQLQPVLTTAFNFLAQTALPALEKMGSTITQTVVPAVTTMAGWFEQHVVPVLTDLGTFVVTKLVPALVSIATSIATNLIPPLMTVGTFIVDHVVKPLVSFVQDVIPPILTAFKFLADHIQIVIGVVGAFALRWAVIEGLGIATTVASFASAFLAFAGEEGVGAATAALAGFGGPGSVMEKVLPGLADFQAALSGGVVPAMEEAAAATTAGAAQMEIDFTTVATSSEVMATTVKSSSVAAGTAVSGMSALIAAAPFAVAIGAAAALGVAIYSIANAETDAQQQMRFLAEQTASDINYIKQNWTTLAGTVKSDGTDMTRSIDTAISSTFQRGGLSIAQGALAFEAFASQVTGGMAGVESAWAQMDSTAKTTMLTIEDNPRAVAAFVSAWQTAGHDTGAAIRTLADSTDSSLRQIFSTIETQSKSTYGDMATTAMGKLSAIEQAFGDNADQAVQHLRDIGDNGTADVITQLQAMATQQGTTLEGLMQLSDAGAIHVGNITGSINDVIGAWRNMQAVATAVQLPSLPGTYIGHAAGGKFTTPHLAAIAEGGGPEWVVNTQQAGAYAPLLDAMVGAGPMPSVGVGGIGPGTTTPGGSGLGTTTPVINQTNNITLQGTPQELLDQVHQAIGANNAELLNVLDMAS